MAEVSSVSKAMISPVANYKLWIYTFTKAGATDYLDCSGEFASVVGVFAVNQTSGAADPATSLTVTAVTFSVGTGVTVALVVGTG